MPKDWAPFAVKKPLHFIGSLPARENSPTAIAHTNGSGNSSTHNLSLYAWFDRPGNDIAAHFQVMVDGTVEQYVPTSRQAYAEFAGNAFAVSFETEDDGDPSHPWTKQQLASIVRICRFVGCPPKVSPDHAGGGVGWHEQYPDWNSSGHVCPGPVRERQLRDVVIPALKHKPEPKWKLRIARLLAEIKHIRRKHNPKHQTNTNHGHKKGKK